MKCEISRNGKVYQSYHKYKSNTSTLLCFRHVRLLFITKREMTHMDIIEGMCYLLNVEMKSSK